jgi:spoIIIJ-associated protein
MSDFKEFQGKDLDGAIESACDYFNLKRDRLEIEIIGGGSSGIFGIMGVKKAKVKARPRASVNTNDLMKEEKTSKKEPKKRESKPKTGNRIPQEAPEPNGNKFPDIEDDINGNVIEPTRPDRKPRDKKPRGNKPRNDRPRNERPRRENKPRNERKPREDRPVRKPSENRPADPRPRANMADFDPTVLEAAVREIMLQLLTPIVGETIINITLDTDRVRVFIDDEENSGLIIGREGQTLSSLQYLVNRLVSRKMQASVRIQVDTGDYRERQDDKLRQVACHLAEKADNIGRTQSTKPLSSYHRRVVHLALQENETVFTRSKGDGPMKRVLIVPKSRKNGSRSQRQ